MCRKLSTVLWPLVAGLGLGVAQAPWAQDELQLFFGYYADDSGLTVQSPSIRLGKMLSEANTFGIKYTREKFNKEAPANAVDAVSGATTVAGGSGSGFSEVRHEWVLTDSHNFGDTAVTGGVFFSEETDFKSEGVSLALSRQMLRNNLTLTGMYNYTGDEIDKHDAVASEKFPRTKEVNGLTLAATQIVNPVLVVVGGYSYAAVEGYQSQPLRKISIDQEVSGGGGTVSYVYEERHPRQRERQTLFFRAKQYFQTRTSADVNLSYYRDDWGVDASAVDIKLQQYLHPMLIVRGRMRYYHQSAADFYRESYAMPQDLMTADSRLRQFDTLLSGVKLLYAWDNLGWRGWSTSLNYERYRETRQGLKADILMLSIKAPL